MDYPHPLEGRGPTAPSTCRRPTPPTSATGRWHQLRLSPAPRRRRQAALTRILDEAWAQDLRYFTNQDTDIHPRTEQWSNGVNQADELDRLMKLRRAALDRMGERTIRLGAPMTTIEEPLVPIYMYHRYAVECGLDGGGPGLRLRDARRRPDTGEVGVGRQPAQALASLAAAIKPSELTILKPILDSIPPRPPGWGVHVSCSRGRPARASIRSRPA